MKFSQFPMTELAMAVSFLARTNFGPMRRGICMIDDGNEGASGGGGDPTPVVNTTNVDGGANPEVQATNIGALAEQLDAGAVLANDAAAVVAEGANTAAVVKTDGDANVDGNDSNTSETPDAGAVVTEGGDKAADADPVVGALIWNSEYCYKKG